MKIDARIEDGNLCIEVADLAEAMSDKDFRTLARHVVFREELLSAVSDMAAKDHCFEDEEGGEWWSPGMSQDIRERLTPLLPNIAREAVKRLLRQKLQAEENMKRAERWANNLLCAWPVGHLDARPREPDWVYSKRFSDSEADAYIAAGRDDAKGGE